VPAQRGAACDNASIARVVGLGVETADMLVSEVLARNLRDCKPVARYAGLTGSPDESGKRREKSFLRAGNARVRCGGALGFLVTEQQRRTDDRTHPQRSQRGGARHRPTSIFGFTDVARQAASYRNGRVLIAGDAAQVHPPTVARVFRPACRMR